MIREQSIAVWAKGREFPFLSPQEKEAYFSEIKKGCSSTYLDERQWAIEAMYRLLWDFSQDQRLQAIDELIRGIRDSDRKCAEYAMKGLQFCMEFLDRSLAARIVDEIPEAVNEGSPEIIQVVAIEVAYSIFSLFSKDKEMALKSVAALLHFEKINPEWLSRTVPSLPRLGSLKSTLSNGIVLPQIGIVRNGYSTLRQMDDFNPNSISEVHIWPEFKDGLKGVKDLEHVVVVCYLDEQNPSTGTGSEKKKHNQNVGEFATSSPIRKSPVFYKTGLVSDVVDNILYVEGVRILDMTPVIDIRAPNPHDMNGLALCRKN